MKTSFIKLQDETSICYYQWLAEKPVAHLLLVHGYAEYAGRYDDFAKHLNEKGISVTSYDQRGYGKSDGLRAYIDRFHRYVSDLAEIRSYLLEPVFLMGHSMGGLVAVQYVLTSNDRLLKGLISSSAALEIDKDLSPFLQMLAPILGAIFPKLPTEKLDKTYLTRDPEVLNDYLNDPLIYLKGTRARTGAEMLKAIKSNREKFNEIDISMLVLHGEADRLTMPGGSKELFEEAMSNDKTLKMYKGLYHELINEPEKDQVIKDICDWILERSN